MVRFYVFFSFPLVCWGFASWMENDFCDRSFRAGEIVMNEITVESEERFLEIYRGNKILESQSEYYPNEVLKVALSQSSGDIIFQVENATYVSGVGGCSGTRSCNQQMITMPSESIGVKIWAGWASEHGVVKVTKDFYLLPRSPPSDQESHVSLLIPNDPKSSSSGSSSDREYLKTRNSLVMEKRQQQRGEEELEIEEEEEELQLEEEEEEEEEKWIEVPSLTTGIEHIDTMAVHLRGVVHENVPSEFHDLFYLALTLVGLLLLYAGVSSAKRCGRVLGLTTPGKSE